MITNQEIRIKITNFKQKRNVRGLRTKTIDTNYFHRFLKKIAKVLEIPNFQRIITPNNEEKIILVSTHFTLEDLPAQDRKRVNLEEVEIEVNYHNLDNQNIFNWFTEKKEGEQGFVPFPHSFETVGHMAHYNLTQQQVPFGKYIGQITLLKCPNIRTVVNKTQKLHNVYRTPALEHLAGSNDYFARVKQQGVQFEFDFQKVYWCSRLQQQRDRLLSIMYPGQLLADLFCGVGPLAVRAARKGLFVIANDLNPHCHEYLEKNCQLNKIQSKVKCWNMCARQAVRKIYQQRKEYQKQFREPDHIYMNLPVDAIEFLDVLADYSSNMETKKMPLVHVNCFVVADSDEKSRELLAIRVKKVLPTFENEDIQQMHHIKNVTVIMRMYCLSIRLRRKQLIIKQGEETIEVDNYEKVRKKIKEQ